MLERTLDFNEKTLRHSRSKETAALWFGILAGMAAFALDEGVSYMLTQHACSTGHFYVLHVTSLICIVISIAGFWTAWTVNQMLPKEANEDGGSMFDRSRFMAMLGMLLSFGFTLTIIAMAVPKLILSPCD